MSKIKMETPLVEIDGDEMTRVLWPIIKKRLLEPFIDLKTEYYDLGIKQRDDTDDQVTINAANAIKKYKVGVKNATITPNQERVEEYDLKRQWKSPNGTIRAMLDGTVFRKPILVKNIKPMVKSWVKPIIVGRHAYGDVYKNAEIKTKTGGKAEIVFTDINGNETRETIIMLLVAKEAGIKDLRSINYIPFDNGGKALLEVISGRAAAFTGDTSEVIGQLQAGEVRALAVLSDNHIPVLGDTKTAKEQGFNVIGGNWRAFYAPAGISDAAYDYWVAAVKSVAMSPEWTELREKNGLAEFTSFGKDFDVFVRNQIENVAALSKELKIIK